MITINDKLYITEEVNGIVVGYAKEIVIRQLLLEFSFKTTKNKKVTDLLETISFYNGDIPPVDMQLELTNLVGSFIKKLNKVKLMALYFWVLNKKYFKYIDEVNAEYEFENDTIENDNFKFGRELALKLYEPEGTELKNDLYNELERLLINFASEFDMSKINKQTKKYIIETIDNYCI
jgi:hypothetical protein